jgi:diguanylate cyclase
LDASLAQLVAKSTVANCVLGSKDMIVLPAAIGAFVLVNLLCACVALGIGFGAGVWFFGTKVAKPTAATNKTGAKKPASSNRNAERAAMASRRVADLAQGVASDVGDHAARMKAISADLAGIDRKASGTNAAVISAMDQILACNSQLQQRLEQAEKQLAVQAAEIKAHESEARTDSLTGLSNRRAFDDEFKRRVNEWERKGTPVSLVLLDIDFFKKFNDTHGHQVGDEVLRQVATTLRREARDMDLPCRYGGEEFAVILPATETAGACIVAERVRMAVEETVINSDGKTLKVTCSIGLSQVQLGDDPAKIIRRADDALYKSKKEGRNCGHWSDGIAHFPICVPPAKPSGDDDAEAAAIETTAESESGGRTTFLHLLKRRVTESHRFGVRLSLVHFKIIDFDSVREVHGNTVAKQMLDLAQPVLEKALRETDDLARLENGEFMVMMPGKTQAEAAQVIKRIKVTMDRCVVPLEDQALEVRFRHGIVELRTNETAQELIARVKLGTSAPAAVRRPARA